MFTPTPLADAVEKAFTEVYAETHAEFGADDTKWRPGQWREYWLRLDTARIENGWVDGSW